MDLNLHILPVVSSHHEICDPFLVYKVLSKLHSLVLFVLVLAEMLVLSLLPLRRNLILF